jgi:hypothetical protein
MSGIIELDNEGFLDDYINSSKCLEPTDFKPYVLQGYTPEPYEWPDTPKEYEGRTFQSLIITFVKGVVLGLALLKVIDLISVLF